MAIQISNTDAFGHVDPEAYAMISCQRLDHELSAVDIHVSVYRNADARLSDVRNPMERKQFHAGADEDQSEYDTLVSNIESDGCSALYDFIKTKDPQLNGGIDV